MNPEQIAAGLTEAQRATLIVEDGETVASLIDRLNEVARVDPDATVFVEEGKQWGDETTLILTYRPRNLGEPRC